MSSTKELTLSMAIAGCMLYSCAIQQPITVNARTQEQPCQRADILTTLGLDYHERHLTVELPGPYCTTLFVADQLHFLAGTVYSKSFDQSKLIIVKNDCLTRDMVSCVAEKVKASFLKGKWYDYKKNPQPIINACDEADGIYDGKTDKIITLAELSGLEVALESAGYLP